MLIIARKICDFGSDYLYFNVDDYKLFRFISGENDLIALQSDLNSLTD